MLWRQLLHRGMLAVSNVSLYLCISVSLLSLLPRSLITLKNFLLNVSPAFKSSMIVYCAGRSRRYFVGRYLLRAIIYATQVPRTTYHVSRSRQSQHTLRTLLIPFIYFLSLSLINWLEHNVGNKTEISDAYVKQKIVFPRT